jgi:DNA-binding response OmpR family regulator
MAAVKKNLVIDDEPDIVDLHIRRLRIHLEDDPSILPA